VVNLHGSKEDSMLLKRIAAYIHLSLRAIARYWSEIATFSYPLAFNAPVGDVPIGIPGKSLATRIVHSRRILQWPRLFRYSTADSIIIIIIINSFRFHPTN